MLSYINLKKKKVLVILKIVGSFRYNHVQFFIQTTFLTPGTRSVFTSREDDGSNWVPICQSAAGVVRVPLFTREHVD